MDEKQLENDIAELENDEEWKKKDELTKNDPKKENVVKQPITWEQLQEYVKKNQYEKLGRSSKEHERYIKSITESPNNLYHSAKDRILHKEFEYDIKKNAKSKFVAIKPKNKKCDDKLFVLNEYPYYFEKDIDHWIIFNTLGDWNFIKKSKGQKKNNENDEDDEDTDSDIKDIINKGVDNNYLGYDVDYIFWKNPDHLQSVKGLFHIHVAIKKNQQENDSVKKLVSASK